MKPYLETREEALKRLESSEAGLSPSEAAARLGKHGPNKLREAEKESLLKRFLGELKDPMTLVLIAAAIVSAVTAIYAGESLADTIIILAVVLITNFVGNKKLDYSQFIIELNEQNVESVLRYHLLLQQQLHPHGNSCHHGTNFSKVSPLAV